MGSLLEAFEVPMDDPLFTFMQKNHPFGNIADYFFSLSPSQFFLTLFVKDIKKTASEAVFCYKIEVVVMVAYSYQGYYIWMGADPK